MEVGSFYVVATPIGNLQDISFRAVEVLKSVDYVACEDTRVTRKLLEKYQISSKLFDYHKFNEKQCSDKIINLLDEGNSIALVSDAGTPGISDPGKVLFEALRQKNIKVTPIPGACAVSTFLSAIERNNECFTFYGFLPKSKVQQEEIFIKNKGINFIFYESPNRLIETLKNVENSRGNCTKIAVGRELTKLFEEIKIGKVSEIIDFYSKNTLKGEIVVMIYPEVAEESSDSELIEKIKLLKSEGFSDKDIAKIISTLFNVNKNRIYKISLSL